MATAWPKPLRHFLVHALAGAVACAAIAGCTEEEPDAAPARAHEKLAEAPEPRLAPVVAPAGRAAPTAASPAKSEPTRPATPAGAAPAEATAGAGPTGYHLDDPEVEYELPRRPERARKGRPIEIVLRSSPPGAVAAVDGVALGPTPSLWEGVADGSPREFTFVLPGYAIARYRFVPTQGGVVHGTLEAIKPEEQHLPPGRRPAPEAAPPASR
jgi:hypothetical protein